MAKGRTRLYDKQGAVVLIEGTTARFICAPCDKTFVELDEGGLTVIVKHGSKKHHAFVSLAALEVAIAYVRKTGRG